MRGKIVRYMLPVPKSYDSITAFCNTNAIDVDALTDMLIDESINETINRSIDECYRTIWFEQLHEMELCDNEIRVLIDMSELFVKEIRQALVPVVTDVLGSNLITGTFVGGALCLTVRIL